MELTKLVEGGMSLEQKKQEEMEGVTIALRKIPKKQEVEEEVLMELMETP